MENKEAYHNARRKARLLKDLYAHLGTYFTVNGTDYYFSLIS